MGITPFSVEERVDKYRKKNNKEEIGIATSARSDRDNNKDTKDLD